MSTPAQHGGMRFPAVAGVGSIQKRQQSAPPYYVFSSDPYSSFQPLLLLVAQFQPAVPCLAATPSLRHAPDSLFPFRPPMVIPLRRNSLLQAGRSQWPGVSSPALIEDDFSVLLFHPLSFRTSSRTRKNESASPRLASWSAVIGRRYANG